MEHVILKDCLGFSWDTNNQTKSLDKHGVFWWECEQVFFNDPLLLYEDVKHSKVEPRHYALGKTDSGRRVFIAFTIRNQLIRVISARDMHKKERKIYEEA